MRFSKNGLEGGQDFELNLASIIDCFTVLITYLLVSASFLSLGVLNVNDLTQRAEGDLTPEAVISLTMDLAENHDLVFKTVGVSPQQIIRVLAKDGQVDRGTLIAELNEMKKKWPKLSTAVLNAASEVEYDQVVRTIDASKELIPNMTLGERI